MEDVFGNELEVGDRVAFNPPKYKGMVTGKILHFSPKTARVSYEPYGKQTTTECSVWGGDMAKDTTGVLVLSKTQANKMFDIMGRALNGKDEVIETEVPGLTLAQELCNEHAKGQPEDYSIWLVEVE